MLTEAIEEQVVSVILPQHSNLAVFVPQAKAVEEQKDLDAQSSSDGGDGGYKKCVGVGIVWPVLYNGTE
jgi:hypothetical protein